MEEQLETFIRSGTYQPGEKLPSVRELCDLFDVGRSAVRDAVTSLKGKGLVEIRQGEGTYLCHFNSAKLLDQFLLLPNMEDIEALFQVREMLEDGMVKLAAQHRTDEDLQAMEEAVNEMKAKGGEDQGLSDYQFHTSIARASGNHILCQLMDFISSSTKKSMVDFHSAIALDSILLREVIQQHERIFAHIKAGEIEQSGKAMMDHLEFVRNFMKKKGIKENAEC
ncbi:FCD domain-containing protein [Halobacillus sp. A5]|uniref:FadR/GntR family transcriptional regulator n=1 Tax=Halobacillus sp. A5 TaxID=2880263 RepID=UPI0020A68C46|nr:FadR family transcriptional regulator [Halobacillus sp. A5]